MSKDGKMMLCITGSNVREIVRQANELEITKEDVVNMFPLGGVLYLIYYK